MSYNQTAGEAPSSCSHSPRATSPIVSHDWGSILLASLTPARATRLPWGSLQLLTCPKSHTPYSFPRLRLTHLADALRAFFMPRYSGNPHFEVSSSIYSSTTHAHEWSSHHLLIFISSQDTIYSWVICSWVVKSPSTHIHEQSGHHLLMCE
jgi:hypothetical protein